METKPEETKKGKRQTQGGCALGRRVCFWPAPPPYGDHGSIQEVRRLGEGNLSSNLSAG